MIVFNACNIIIKRRFATFALYFLVFMALTIVIPMISSELYTTDFSAVKPNFTVINRDGDTPLSGGLSAYLGERGHEVALDDRKEVLQDASFFNATDYIIILPDGFRDAFFNGQPLLIETVATTESAKGLYVDMLVNQYLNQARLYNDFSPHQSSAESNREGIETANMDEAALVSAVLNDLSIETGVETMRFGAGAPVDLTYQIYNNMLCYILIVLVIVFISNLTSSFRRPDIRMRNLCAPVKPRSMGIQQILCGVLVSLAAWVLLTAMGFIVFGSNLAGADRRAIGLLLLNSLVMTFVALSIASLVSSFIKSPTSQNAAANFVSLGLCFLGGVFVPISLLGEGVLTVARFTPTYWYVMAVANICELTAFSREALAPIWQSMLTMLIFTATLFCLSLVISKHLNQSERFSSNARTEVEG